MKPIKLSRQSCMDVIWHYVTITKTSAELLHDRLKCDEKINAHNSIISSATSKILIYYMGFITQALIVILDSNRLKQINFVKSRHVFLETVSWFNCFMYYWKSHRDTNIYIINKF